MDSEELERLVALARRMLVAAMLCVVAMAVIAAIDYKLKKDIVTQADAWRSQMRHSQGGARGDQRDTSGYRPAPRGPRPAVPDPLPVIPHVADVVDASGGAADGYQATAPPIVAPGNERARPPHRGGVDGF